MTGPVPGPPFAAAYDELRETGDGVHRAHLPDGAPVWLVTRYHDVSAALADPRLRLDKRHSTGWSGFSLPAELDANLLNMDPPDHTRVRRLVTGAFTASRVQTYRPAVRRAAAELADALPGRGPVDLIEAYAAPLPVRVIADLLGVGPERRDDFRTWTTTMLTSTDRAAVGAAVGAVHAFIVELVGLKRRDPGDDLLSVLTSVEDGGARLSSDELTSLAFLLLMAGYENSVNLIGSTVLAGLATGTWPVLPDDLVATCLRRYPPAPVAIRRFPVEDVVIGTTTVPAGDTVLLGLLAANRDPRADGPHLSYGRGIHHCVGAGMATLEVEVALATLAERVPAMALAVAVEELDWRPSWRSFGPATLPVHIG